MLLKLILKEYVLRVLTGLIWLWIRVQWRDVLNMIVDLRVLQVTLVVR
jgi:hypothetical protein